MGLCSLATSLIIGIHGVSYHTNTASERNNYNYGLYAAYNSYEIGAYRNSFHRTSVYFGKEIMSDNDCKYSLGLGGITGYNSSVQPLVVLNRYFDTNQIVENSTIRLQMMKTSLRDPSKFVFHLSFQKKF